MAVTPRNEQEAILSYDSESREWHYYSDVPTLNRKWHDKIDPSRITVEDNGTISELEGTVVGTVIISKKRVMTDGQRQEAAERLKQFRESL